jgi:hypothetical protein
VVSIELTVPVAFSWSSEEDIVIDSVILVNVVGCWRKSREASLSVNHGMLYGYILEKKR